MIDRITVTVIVPGPSAKAVIIPLHHRKAL